MADTFEISDQAVDVQLVAFGNELNNGKLRYYSGPIPPNAAAALSGNTLLAEQTFSATAFGSPQDAIGGRKIVANAIASVTAVASGTCNFVRALKSDGTTVIAQYVAGTAARVRVRVNADADAGATSLNADTDGALPNGAVIEFENGVRATLTASAAQGTGVTLSVSALVAAVPAETDGVYNPSGAGDVVLNDLNIVAGGQVSVSSFEHYGRRD